MDPTTITVLAIVVVLVLILTFAMWVVFRNLPFADGDVFRASRLSGGNRLFPTQVAVTPSSVVHYTPHWIGAHEHSIHMAHVASVRVDSRLLFADVFIETTGGTGGIRCRGHQKSDADRMKQLIERYQSEYFRSETPPPLPR